MLNLPKFEKGMKRALTRKDRVAKAIMGLVIVAGISMAVAPISSAKAESLGLYSSSSNQSSLLLTPAQTDGSTSSYHQSHYSHSSHESHSSHYSHYSSRY